MQSNPYLEALDLVAEGENTAAVQEETSGMKYMLPVSGHRKIVVHIVVELKVIEQVVWRKGALVGR